MHKLTDKGVINILEPAKKAGMAASACNPNTESWRQVDPESSPASQPPQRMANSLLSETPLSQEMKRVRLSL